MPKEKITIRRELANLKVKLLYELIQSKKSKTVISSKEIYSYINKKIKSVAYKGRTSLTYLQVTAINQRQLKYHVFRRQCKGYMEYIYVKRRSEDVTRQIQNYKRFSK